MKSLPGAIVAIFLVSCSERPLPQAVTIVPSPVPVNFSPHPKPPRGVTGQVIYVPVYSHYSYRQQTDRELEFQVTLSVRNTDTERAIAITSLRYHDRDGKLLWDYRDGPLILPPLATRDFTVENKRWTGDSGASFLVEWTAGGAVKEPLVEALMIWAEAGVGLSIARPGKVIESYPTPAP